MTESLLRRYEDNLATLQQHLAHLVTLHHRCFNELLPSIVDSLALDPFAAQLVSSFLNDRHSLYRFLLRCLFDIDGTLAALSNSIRWRLSSNIHLISQSNIDPAYLNQPLFYFHPSLCDKWSRPCAVLNLRYLRRTEDGTLESLKEVIAWNFEMARKLIHDSGAAQLNQLLQSSLQAPSGPSAPAASASHQPSPSVVLQFVIMVDLKDASMSNLEIELLPYLVDLVRHNFPGMVAAIFVLNYGWMYAGMWQVAKRILPQQTLDRIFFPTQADLFQFFHPSNLLVEHGGQLVYKFLAHQNPVIRRYGNPLPPVSSATPSIQENIRLSRPPSVESLHDVFFSAANTPCQTLPSHPGTPNRTPASSHHHRPSWLSMTALTPTTHFSPQGLGQALEHNRLKPVGRAWPFASGLELHFPLRLRDRQCSRGAQDDGATRRSTRPAVNHTGSAPPVPVSLPTCSSACELELSKPIRPSMLATTSASEIARPTFLSRNGAPIQKSCDKASGWYKILLRMKYLSLKLQLIIRLTMQLTTSLTLHHCRRDLTQVQPSHVSEFPGEKNNGAAYHPVLSWWWDSFRRFFGCISLLVVMYLGKRKLGRIYLFGPSSAGKSVRRKLVKPQ